VIILRALQLGDLLCAVPAFRTLRKALPNAEIVLLSLPWARVFVERYCDYLDGFREFPGYPGLPERVPQVERIPSFLAEIQAERFDLALQMHGSGPFVNPLTVLFGARRNTGFYLPGDYCPDPDLFMRYPDHSLEVLRLLKLVEFLGVPAQGEELEFPLYEEDYRELQSCAGTRHLSAGSYACIHPGASVSERRWPAERFTAIGKALARRGLTVVLTGTAAEAGLTREVGRGMHAGHLDLAGQTSLGALAALLDGAQFLICNDTGVSHLAAALGVPSVIISTGNNPERWAPSDGERHRVLCGRAGVGVEEVLHQCAVLLERRDERRCTRQRNGRWRNQPTLEA
jgi:ADP-heptose:LPS heptosyltransferase